MFRLMNHTSWSPGHETPFLCRRFLRHDAPHGMINPRQIAEYTPVYQHEHDDGKTADWKAFELAGLRWTLSDPVQE